MTMRKAGVVSRITVLDSWLLKGRMQNGACGHTYIILLWEIYVAGMRCKNVFFHRDIVKVSQAVL